ncbi:MAG: ATP-binding protein [candidate division KSB1 bacterium]|nr:ATP-binding protein [candidate division KSB1 bacterium]MDQ7063322.1 ATP-binding protein [candidate division KSB1 bacterium]
MHLEKLLQNRKTVVVTLIAAIFLVLGALNLFSWLFFKRMEANLDHELGRRLQSVAGLVARLAESEIFGTKLDAELNEVERYILQTSLDELRDINQLQAIYLVTPELVTIFSSPPHFKPGEMIRYLMEDSLQIQLALQGRNQASPLHVIEGNRFKSGYAPFHNELGKIIGLVIVEASADFFSLLKFYRRGLILGGIVSFMVVLLVAFFISWIVMSFVRLQERLHQNERLAAMGQMAATVAHEIRNPLGIIKSTAEVLRNRYRNPEKQDELLEFIPSEVDRLNRLVSDFLTFARDRQYELETGDLVATIEKAIEDIRAEMAGTETRIQFEPSVSKLAVPHHSDAIRQVILNLVRNAVEAMNGSGDVKVLIIPETKWGRKQVKVSVADNGPGVSGDPEKIFEPFYTTKTSGSGLGLAITRQIIEKHGGKISIHSHPGEGTTVTFFLPR